MYITNIKVNDGRKSAIFLFDQVDIFKAYEMPPLAHFSRHYPY